LGDLYVQGKRRAGFLWGYNASVSSISTLSRYGGALMTIGWYYPFGVTNSRDSYRLSGAFFLALKKTLN